MRVAMKQFDKGAASLSTVVKSSFFQGQKMCEEPDLVGRCLGDFELIGDLSGLFTSASEYDTLYISTGDSQVAFTELALSISARSLSCRFMLVVVTSSRKPLPLNFCQCTETP
ncbi:hypothetical protein HAX54_000366 [Datura stramonium]|uniref:Uncharacterized protein n=1 Tax=Datura stramonium TaxID=4076 RepID=A0ABS8WSA1_DATST|nr:hypothetical protein [Datura stramonium]